jgi:predicted FMN-binding regulatory protein PaiB
MYVPPHFREPDKSWIIDLIRANPLAQLISNGEGDGAPRVTHVPIIVDPGMADALAGHPSGLVGATLWGHMSRMNPHWAALHSPTHVAVTFTGPHAYISPTVYQATPSAPTWTFTAVHVTGRLCALQSADDTLESVQATARALEGRFGAGWDISESAAYLRQILPGVGAFRIAVSHVDGMFKLSQEQQPEVRRRVQDSFAQRESTNHREIASLMSRLSEAC